MGSTMCGDTVQIKGIEHVYLANSNQTCDLRNSKLNNVLMKIVNTSFNRRHMIYIIYSQFIKIVFIGNILCQNISKKNNVVKLHQIFSFLFFVFVFFGFCAVLSLLVFVRVVGEGMKPNI